MGRGGDANVDWSVPVQDLAAFKKEIDELGAALKEGQGEADRAHFERVRQWTRWLGFLGVATMGLHPLLLFPAILYSLGTTARWTMVGHHTSHGGYDWMNDKRFNRKFGMGAYRRFWDWLDWWLPEAWNAEHNKIHHYRLGEVDDPDLVEHNLSYLRGLEAPLAVKKVAVFFMMCIWKWWYYAPNTYKCLQLHEMAREKRDAIPLDSRQAPAVLSSIVSERSTWSWYDTKGVFLKVLGPYFLYTFVVLPLPWLAVFGRTCFYNALLNMILAEIFSNVHSFIIIATNHCGDDLYRFDTPCPPQSGEWYLRQIISTANYAAGTDAVDFLHGYLNYQVEHHLWPNLSMLSYRKAMPLVKQICIKHQIPYVQQSVWTRLDKTVDVMTGQASMLRRSAKSQ